MFNHLSVRKFGAQLGIVAALTLAASIQAETVDLVTGDEGYVNGAYFQTTDIQPTGTGVFDPFLTIQNKGTEQGYNGEDGNFDTKRIPQWNHEIRFSDLTTTVINNVSYYGFVIDINDPNSTPTETLTLTHLKIYTSDTVQSNTESTGGIFSGKLGILRYDLGAGNTVNYLDDQSGSGSGDINFFIPTSYFAGTEADDYVYMYQRFTGTEGGFEETAILQGVAYVSP